jgi:hypothetical protein
MQISVRYFNSIVPKRALIMVSEDEIKIEKNEGLQYTEQNKCGDVNNVRFHITIQ